jgi:methyl-accepting chemotaxis protein
MSNAPDSHKRKSYLIKPPFQWKMISYAAGLSLFILAILYFANHYFIMALRQQGIDAGLSPDNPFFSFLLEQAHFLDLIFLGVAIVVNLVVILGGLWLSNRIAGPIYRVETSLKELAEGRSIQPISFRKSDFFPDLVMLINQFAEKQNRDKHTD